MLIWGEMATGIVARPPTGGRLARRREPIRSTVTPDTVPALLAEVGWRTTLVQDGPELARAQLDGTGLTTEGVNPGSAVVVAER